MDNTLDIDESTPLTGEVEMNNESSTANNKTSSLSSILKKLFNQIKNNGILLLIAGVLGIFIGTRTSGIFGEAGASTKASSAASTATGTIPESLPPPPVVLQEPVTTKVMYRPFCLTHGTPTARTLQTSMGQPSQQWAHVPCYAQTESSRVWSRNAKPAIHLNAYGAPDAIIRLNTSSVPFAHRKPILGFGAAFTEAAALNYGTLSEQGKQSLMELVYGKSGLGYSIGRVHINSCDFSVQSYSFDDVDGDFDLDHFDVEVTHDVQVGMVEMILRATSVFNTEWRSTDGVDGHFQMYASPWSPPAWMKQPNWRDKEGAIHAENMTGSTEPSCLREGTQKNSRYAKAWALYFSKFITAYRDQGIPLWAVTVQNEPEFPAPWEACAYTPMTEMEFVAYHLGPQLEKDHPDVDIFMFDHNKDHVVTWASTLLNTSYPSAKYIKGTAYHWYAGGMDRLLDGAVGTPNLHRLQTKLQALNVSDDHVILGSEACHCPTTGYAGGDIEIYWSRAERYAHAILADLAAGSNGWVEWNLILDGIGGPNHLGNLCDAAILAVPHRGINGTDIPTTADFEHAGHPFGPSVGDGRTREELNALGFPAKHLDNGLAVQPIYYYMGHISRYVRPGSRAISALVDNAKDGYRAFRVPNQVVAGGGLNDLARTGIELTAWPCEGSTRQQFKLTDALRQIQVFGHDWLGKPTTSCVRKVADKSFKGITMTDCDKKDYGSFEMDNVLDDDGNYTGYVRIRLSNGAAPHCLVLQKLNNGGGAYGPRGGAQVTFGDCRHNRANWKYSEQTGEISSNYLEAGEVCMTTGWPFLQIGAYDTPNGEAEKTVLILNEAKEPANYALYDGEDALMSGSIPPRSIQTVLLDFGEKR